LKSEIGRRPTSGPLRHFAAFPNFSGHAIRKSSWLTVCFPHRLTRRISSRLTRPEGNSPGSFRLPRPVKSGLKMTGPPQKNHTVPSWENQARPERDPARGALLRQEDSYCLGKEEPLPLADPVEAAGLKAESGSLKMGGRRRISAFPSPDGPRPDFSPALRSSFLRAGRPGILW
jgi:hypothetical protein